MDVYQPSSSLLQSNEYMHPKINIETKDFASDSENIRSENVFCMDIDESSDKSKNGDGDSDVARGEGWLVFVFCQLFLY